MCALCAGRPPMKGLKRCSINAVSKKDNSDRRKENVITQDGQQAVTSALEAASEAYAQISGARNELNALEARGVYAENYIAQQRQQRAASVRSGAEQRLRGAQESIGANQTRIVSRVESARAIDPDTLGSAQSTLAPFMGDPRETPE